MGRKTTGNDLDNAWVRFDHLRVPQTALLNRYGSIVNDQYVPTMKGIRTMDMIGQRLFTGRVAVAQAALGFARQLFATTRAYSDNKMCTMRGDAPVGPARKCSKHHRAAFKSSHGFGIESKVFGLSQRPNPNLQMKCTQYLLHCGSGQHLDQSQHRNSGKCPPETEFNTIREGLKCVEGHFEQFLAGPTPRR